MAQSTAAAQLLLGQTTHPPREWVHFLLQLMKTFGEFHHLVRDLRLDNERDFFTYFRMTRQRYVLQSLPDYLSAALRLSSAGLNILLIYYY